MERKTNYSRFTDRYLDGELGEHEQQRFEKELSSNPELAKDLELHREVNHALQETDVLGFRNQLDQIHASIEPGYKQSITRKVLQSKYARIAAASVAILLAVGLIFGNMLNQPVNTDELFERYYDAPPLSRTTRSDAQVENVYMKALEHYKNERFADAAKLFEQVVELNKYNIPAHMGAGVSNLENNQPEKAKGSFKEIIGQEDNLYIDQATWYLGLCYLKTRNLDNARTQFDIIVSGNRPFKQDEAKKILKKLDR